MIRRFAPLMVILAMCIYGCGPGQTTPNGNGGNNGGNGGTHGDPAARIQPSDLEYLGAFRLPDRVPDSPDAEGWEYGCQALAYRPDGDPGGDADGHPGSLFGTGHEVHNYISEISIPAPSLSRELGELNTATTIQGFHDVRAGLFDPLNELPRVGMEYLAAQTGQTSAKLYLAWGQHFQEDGSETAIASHAWCDLDLSNPNTQGAWWVGDESLYATNGYIMALPEAWAEQYTRRNAAGNGPVPGRRLVRDGPFPVCVCTVAGWHAACCGNAPELAAAPALLQHPGRRYHRFRLDDYQHSDEWEGGAFLTASGDRSAVVFVGTKGSGYLWYGFFSPGGDGMPCVEQGLTMVGCFNPDGTECSATLQGECPGHVAESRGWWSSRWDAQIIFYDAAELAAVADGDEQPYEPQPYATLDIDEHLFLNATVDTNNIGTGDQRRFRLGETAYDREHGLLYIPERFADDAKAVIHVWRVH